MIFNFQEFTRIAAEVYRGMETEESLGRCFDFDETLYVFQAYFAAYEQHTGKPHPPIKSGQIRRIIFSDRLSLFRPKQQSFLFRAYPGNKVS